MTRKTKRKRTTRNLARHVREPGAAPGTLHSRPGMPQPKIEVFRYGPEDLDQFSIEDLNDIPSIRDDHVIWVNVEGLGDLDVPRKLGELFGLHPLALEDSVNLHQRAKVEEYEDHLFIVLWMIMMDKDLEFEQVSLFVGKGFVITLQEGTLGDNLGPVRERLKIGRGRILKAGADYLAYALIDAIIDGYFPVLERFSDEMEETERAVIAVGNDGSLSRILDIKHELQILRRSIWPLREMTNVLTRDTIDLIHPETRLYLRDCHDHAIQAIELVESYRERASTLMEAHMSSVSFRMNQVMQVLTVISTLFIPLTFIVGVYGMNFDGAVSYLNMPELRWAYGYPMLWVVMLLIVGAQLYLFHQIGWLSVPRRSLR